MINIFALGLLISSLAAAGVWSPPPPANPHDVVIREGHRVIVVEYERQIPSPSSQQDPQPAAHDHPQHNNKLIEQVKDKFQEASSHLPENAGVMEQSPKAHSAKELICDAYGTCKEKISSAFHKGKDKVSRKASDVEESAKDAVVMVRDKASDVEESARDAIKNQMEDTKEAIKNRVEGAKDAVKSKMESTKEAAKDAKDAVKSKMESTIEAAKDAVENKMENTKDVVKNKMESTKDAVRSAGEDVAGNITHATEQSARFLHTSLRGLFKWAKHVAFDAAKYADGARSVASIVHLVGFAIAYGTGVWVTFVSSHVLASALPRQQFGTLQSKLYPVYFRAVAYGLGGACLGHFCARDRVVGVERVQGYNLMAALLLVLVNMFYLEPKATKVMFERLKMEKEEGRGRDMADALGEPVMTASTATTTTATPQSAATVGVKKTTVSVDHEAVKSRTAKLNKKLKKLNIRSSFLNILSLMSMTWHLVHLARQLQVTCP